MSRGTTGEPYVMVHRSIVDDPRFAEVFDDKALLGWWVTLKIAADAAWPSSAELPSGCPAGVVDQLAGTGLIAPYPRNRYRMPDYDIEREERAEAARAGGRARAASGSRSDSGRYQRSVEATATSGWDQPPNATHSNSSHSRRPALAPLNGRDPTPSMDAERARAIVADAEASEEAKAGARAYLDLREQFGRPEREISGQ